MRGRLNRHMGRRVTLVAAAALALLTGAAGAAVLPGSQRADFLRGSPRADRIDARGGGEIPLPETYAESVLVMAACLIAVFAFFRLYIARRGQSRIDLLYSLFVAIRSLPSHSLPANDRSTAFGSRNRPAAISEAGPGYTSSMPS